MPPNPQSKFRTQITLVSSIKMAFKSRIVLFVVTFSCFVEFSIFASPVSHNPGSPRSNKNQSLEFIDPRTWDENVEQLQEMRSLNNKSEHFQKEENRKVPSRRRSELVKSNSQGQNERVKIPFEGGGEYLFSNSDQQRYKGSVGQDFRLDEGEDEEIAKRILFRHWPDKMAAYIYETGDEETVASTVENYLQLGILDREQALVYLQRIKTILDELRAQEVRNKKREEQQYYENLFTSRKNMEDINEEAEELKDIRRLLQHLLLTALTNTLQDYSPVDVHQNNQPITNLPFDKTGDKLVHEKTIRKEQSKQNRKALKNSLATSGLEDEP